jgi:DNA-binding GntR family transcriptional regulator
MHRRYRIVDAGAVKPPPRQPLQARLFGRIREAICSGELQPGDPIQELHVARQFQVSQTSVREALAKLEHAGLVRRVPNIGTFVTQLSAQEIREHLRLRLLLEGLAGMEAARWSHLTDFAELDRRHEELKAAVAGDRHYEAAQADLEFHRFVWEQARDRTLYRILDQLTVPLFAFVSIQRHRSHQELARAVRSHEPIVGALKIGDPVAVREALRVHVETSYAEFLGGGVDQQYIVVIGDQAGTPRD